MDGLPLYPLLLYHLFSLLHAVDQYDSRPGLKIWFPPADCTRNGRRRRAIAYECARECITHLRAIHTGELYHDNPTPERRAEIEAENRHLAAELRGLRVLITSADGILNVNFSSVESISRPLKAS